MPRSFDMATDYAGTVQQVHDALRDKQYWLARLAASGADEWTLDDFQAGHDGGVDVVTTQVLRAERLPGIIHQFHHGDLEIRRAETWTALFDGAAEAAVASSIVRAPVALDGQARLTGEGSGSRLAFSATVDVRIPLVGGKMEKFIANQLIHLLNDEQRFTSEWITGTRR
ncbi:MAG: DUF2505 domain-containing protein [Mycobacterium sp.]